MADERLSSPEKSREALRNFVLDIEPDAVEAAVREDPGLARDLAFVRLKLLMACSSLAGAMADYGSGLSAEERSRLVEDIMSELDGGKLAASMNSVSSFLLKLRNEDAPIEEPVALATREFIEQADFGKTREAFEWWCGLMTSTGSEAIEEMMANPVVAANIFAMLPPLVNAVIRLFSKFVDSMNLPSEILASALFNIISELDAEELGRGLTAAARQVNSLHEGSKVLGGEEPRFRAVFSGFMSRMLDETDPGEIAGMLVAVAEDVEVMAGVMAGINAGDDDLMVLTALTGARLSVVIARTVTGVLLEMGKVPRSTWERVGREMLASMDPAEIGRAINAWVDLGLAFREANPDFNALFLEGAFSRLDFEKLELLLAASLSDMGRAVRSSPGLIKTLEPEQMGRRINDALKAFNSSVASPGTVRDYVARLMSVIDTRELSGASKKLAKGMTEGMLAGAEQGEVILKSFMSAAWSVVRFIFRRAADRLRGLKAGR